MSRSNSLEVLKETLNTSDKDSFEKIHEKRDNQGLSQQKFQQYYNGIKVQYGIYNVNSKNGIVESIGGEYYELPELNTIPAISEASALKFALAHVNAKKYMWEESDEELWLKKETGDQKATFYPKAELVICRDYLKATGSQFNLAYKFNIYAKDPLGRSYIYVDAQEGKIIHQDAIIKHVDGSAQTRYSGTRTIGTELSGGNYVLHDLSRGQGVETYNLNRGTSYSDATNFIDDDNNWTTAEHGNANIDDAALDAHWASMMTYDYFKNEHDRNSFDNNGAKIKSYVHFGSDYNNAFWNGSVMTYGDGNNNPLTTMDITAHEIGHAVCESTAGLVYSYESGALNEGLSDIWGATIEFYADPTKGTWTMGEDINDIIRSLSNPNEYACPDTYLGDFWYPGPWDNGGVHTNSGVLNHWYYLLVVGKTGNNDNGDSYDVSGIGMDKASKIVYRTESIYLTANSQYADARNYSIQAATDLYGEGSNEVTQTINAWNAVGVYDLTSAPSDLTATTASTTQINLTWVDNATEEIGFIIERSLTSGGNFVVVDTVGADITSFEDAGLVTDNLYFYKVCALKETYKTGYSNEANAIVGTGPVIMSNATVTTCNAIFLDPGGAGDYGINQDLILTFVPTTPDNKIQVSFSSFYLDTNYDYLYIYDGASTSAPLIGYYTGPSVPPAVTATNETGELTFRFYSDSYVTKSGWQANIICIPIPATPSGLTATTESETQVNLSWTDNSSTETGFKVERSVTPAENFVQIAEVDFNTTTFNDTGLSTNNIYYYRVRAYQGTGNSNYSNIANATVGSAPIIMANGSVTTCDATFLDPGGNGNYGNSQNYTMTLTPSIAGNKIKITFNSFTLEGCCDYLRVYDGPTKSSPQIGSYNGQSIPDFIYATNETGALTFSFQTDGSVVYSGWDASIECVTTVPLSDLVIPTAYVSSSEIPAGNALSARYHILNQGGTLAATSNVSMYLSLDSIYNSFDTLLANHSGNSLQAGNSYYNSLSATVPSFITPGNYYILLVADNQHTVEEADETNNVSNVAISVIAPTKDLIILSPYIENIDIAPGEALNVSCYLKNEGNAATSSNLGYYFSIDNQWSNDDIFLDSSSGGNLEGGNGETRQANFNIPSGTIPGNYFIVFFADYDSSVTETNETNNTAALSLTISAPFVDLIIENGYISSPLVIGGTAHLECYIRNQGNISSSSSNVGYYLSSDLVFDANDILLGSTSGNALGRGRSSSKYITFNIPASINAGSYYILYYADHTQSVAENNEDNNINSRQITISDPIIDLLIDVPSLSSSSIPAGNSVTAYCYISNQGNSTSSASDVGFYLSSDVVWDASDILLYESDGGSISKNNYRYINASLTIPSNVTGDYYLIFYADFTEEVTESNEVNNFTYLPLTITASGSEYYMPTSGTLIVSTCTAKILDDGGNGNYNNGVNGIMIINPTTTNGKVSLTFSSFSVESCCDRLRIYDGNSTASPQIGTYSSNPGTITATNASGALTLYWLTDGSYTMSGFEAQVACIAPLTDLLIQAPQVSAQEIPAGRETSVSCNILNNGESNAPYSTVGYFLSDDAIFDNNDVSLGFSDGGILNSGQAASKSSDITIPVNTSPGKYYIIFHSDYLDQVEESNENNNIAYSEITIYRETIDLTINAGSLSSDSISAGHQITASISIFNNGSKSSSSSDIAFYLSADTDVDGNDILLKALPGDSLKAQSSRDISSTLVIPKSTSPGEYYILFLADNLALEDETDEFNNQFNVLLKVVPLKADLAINTFTTNSTHVVGGTSLLASVVVENLGYLNTASSELGYFISDNASFENVDIFISSTNLKAIGSKESIQVETSITIPSTLVTGNYYIVVLSDYTKLIVEENESNNAKAIQIHVTSPHTDLVMNSPENFPNQIETGQQVHFSSKISNIGNFPNSITGLSYYLSMDSLKSNADIFLNSNIIDPIDSNSSKIIETSLVIPETVVAGMYHILSIADNENLVIESNEENNLFHKKITVLAPTGIENEVSNNIIVNVFPNPNTGNFELVVTEIINEEKVICTFYNGLGYKLAEKTVPVYQGKAQSLMKLDLPNGAYILKIKIGETLLFKKVLVE